MRTRLAAVVTILLGMAAVGAPWRGADDVPVVRITSPVGRTGAAPLLRIVAQIQWPAAPRLGEPPRRVVRFFVDGQLVGSVDSGPPYAIPWADDNPFEAREIVVEAQEESGLAVRDTVRLPAFEVSERTDISSIVVDASVVDAKGKSVAGLTARDFVVRESGEQQVIDVLSQEAQPTTVLLLIDSSRSMARRFNAVRQTASWFARALTANDSVIVAPFAKGIGIITGPTKDVATVDEALRVMEPGGSTAIRDALADATRILDGVSGRRAVVLFSDGFDESSTIDFDTAVQRLQNAGITVYSVAVGGVNGVSRGGEVALRRVTTETGGRSYFPWNETELQGITREIIADARGRYLLGYTPTNQKKDGTWREIQVGAGDGLRVRARAGYRAPMPPPIRPAIEFRIADAKQSLVSIAAEDLEVLEDGDPQTIDTFQEAIDPVSIVLLLDASGSMTRSAELVRQTARDFVSAVRPEDSLAIITFANEPLFAHLLSVNRELSLRAVDAYKTGGGTALYDGLYNSLLHLKPVTGRRAIVVLTDGRDEDNAGTGPGSAHSAEEVLELARQVNATTFTVGLGTRVDEAVLSRFAAASGGEAYLSPDPTGLPDTFRKIVENLRQRYMVSYTSTHTEHDGRWRRVELRPRDRSLTVAGTAGYFAPGP